MWEKEEKCDIDEKIGILAGHMHVTWLLVSRICKSKRKKKSVVLKKKTPYFGNFVPKNLTKLAFCKSALK